MKKISVLIIDDHAILRMGLASLLNAKGDIDVVGDAANGQTGIQKALKLKPDVVVMDPAVHHPQAIEPRHRQTARHQPRLGQD